MKRPRPRRTTQRCYWPHLHGHMRLTPRGQIGRELIIITYPDPLPADLPQFGAHWPALRAQVLARLREMNPNHPWLKQENTP